MRKTDEIIKKEDKTRLAQAEEMSLIWEKSTKEIQMYLKGCMVTAAAFAGQYDGTRKNPVT